MLGIHKLPLITLMQELRCKRPHFCLAPKLPPSHVLVEGASISDHSSKILTSLILSLKQVAA